MKLVSITHHKNGNTKKEEYFDNRENVPFDSKVIWYYENGNKKEEWHFKDNLRHNSEGPSFVKYYKNGNIKIEGYCQDNEYHKLDGPAIIWYDENGNIEDQTYSIYGKVYDEFQYWVCVSSL